MTPRFIFFHGVAVNTTNMLSGTIWRDKDDATKSRLYLTTENGGEQHALDVSYDTARDEWAQVWTRKVAWRRRVRAGVRRARLRRMESR